MTQTCALATAVMHAALTATAHAQVTLIAQVVRFAWGEHAAVVTRATILLCAMGTTTVIAMMIHVIVMANVTSVQMVIVIPKPMKIETF
jgi:hypothetical protein